MKKKRNKLIWIYSIPQQNFLGECGFWPVVERNNAAGYKSSKGLRAAMESYEIRQMFYHNGRY